MTSNGHRNTIGPRDRSNVDCGDRCPLHGRMLLCINKCLSKKQHRQKIKRAPICQIWRKLSNNIEGEVGK